MIGSSSRKHGYLSRLVRSACGDPWVAKRRQHQALVRACKCVAYGAGIIGMRGMYSIIQDRIVSEPYAGEFFKASVFLAVCNRLVAMFYAGFMVWYRGEGCKNIVPLRKYFVISLSTDAAAWCQYQALRHVSFPTEVFGRSFKMIPVMLWGFVIFQTQYRIKDWAISLVVTFGVFAFLILGEINSEHTHEKNSTYGMMLLLTSFIADGFTPVFQERLFKKHKMSKYNQLLYLNGGSAAISIGILMLSGLGHGALGFCATHPDFVAHAAALSVVATAGQFFVYSQVKEFGALVFAVTMNLRQVFSILTLHVVYWHLISLAQFLALIPVVGALAFLRSCEGACDKAKDDTDLHSPGLDKTNVASSNALVQPRNC